MKVPHLSKALSANIGLHFTVFHSDLGLSM
jgi:hypothetical protein